VEELYQEGKLASIMMESEDVVKRRDDARNMLEVIYTYFSTKFFTLTREFFCLILLFLFKGIMGGQ